MLRPCLQVITALALPSLLLAQVPSHHVVILESTAGPSGPARCLLVDVTNLGQAMLPATVIDLPLPQVPAGVALDAASAGELYLQYPPASASPGIHRVSMGMFATPSGPATTAPWSQPGGTRIRVGDDAIYTLRAGGVIERTAKAGGPSRVVMQHPDAVDIAVIEQQLFVACRDPKSPQTPAPLFEIDLRTGARRIVGFYADMLSLASEVVRLCHAVYVVVAGTGSGEVFTIDLATGVAHLRHTAPGPVERIAMWPFGAVVYGVRTATGFDVCSDFGRIYTSPSATLVDLDISVASTASVVSFGQGCAAGSAIAWGASSLPTLGNSRFALSLAQVSPGVPMLLVFRADVFVNRAFANSLGAVLPIDLSALASGCQLLVDPVVSVFTVASPAGTWEQALPIPQMLGLQDVELSGQAFVLDAASGGFGASAGIVCRLFGDS